MVFVGLGMRPWILVMKSQALHPRVLADDILLLAFDDDPANEEVLRPIAEAYSPSAVNGHDNGDTDHINWAIRFQRGFQCTIQYFIDIGARVSVTKSLLFASTPALRRVLEDTTWTDHNGRVHIQVVKDFRDLGAHFTAGGNLRSTTLSNRIVTTTSAIHRAAGLPLTHTKKKQSVQQIFCPRPSMLAKCSRFPSVR